MFGVLHLEQVITRADPYARDFAVMEVARRVVDGRRLLGNEVAVLGTDVVAHGRAHDLATALLNLLVNAERHAPGTQVTIAFDGDESDTDTFVLGSRELLGLDASVDTNVYSPQSPLGAAILGKSKGDAVSYIAPNGRTINVTIVAVQPFHG